MGREARSSNFSPREVEILMNLITKYKHVIESKKLNRVSVERKIKVWKDIEQEFNARSGQVYRNLLVLKKKHENMKKQAKRQKQELNSPEGPGTSSNLTEISPEMEDYIVPKMELIEDPNECNNPDITIGTTSQNEKVTDRPEVHIRKKNSSKLRMKTNWNKLTNAGIQLIQESMKCMKEKHKKEMELMDREYVEKLKMMREKYLLEVKVLQTKLEINKRQLAEK